MPIDGIFAGLDFPRGETMQRVRPKRSPNKRIQPPAPRARRG